MDSYDPDAPLIGSDWLNLDEGERIELVSSYHRRTKTRLPNSQLHAVIHVIIENQLALEEEAVVKTLTRLQSDGLSRHDALHAIGSVLAEDLYELMREGSASESQVRARYFARLEKLRAQDWRAG